MANKKLTAQSALDSCKIPAAATASSEQRGVRTFLSQWLQLINRGKNFTFGWKTIPLNVSLWLSFAAQRYAIASAVRYGSVSVCVCIVSVNSRSFIKQAKHITQTTHSGNFADPE